MAQKLNFVALFSELGLKGGYLDSRRLDKVSKQNKRAVGLVAIDLRARAIPFATNIDTATRTE
jgi:hypothetical protein